MSYNTDFLYTLISFFVYSCKLPNSLLTKFNEGFTKQCDPGLRINSENGYLQQSFIHFVRDAAYAFAYALHNMHTNLCNGKPGICNAMSHIDGAQLLPYLQNVTFKGKY